MSVNAALVGSSLFIVQAMRDAADDMQPGEVVLSATACSLDGRRGVAVVTDRRVMFRSRLLWLLTASRDISRDKISGVTSTGGLSHSVSVASSGSTISLSNVSNAGAKALLAALR